MKKYSRVFAKIDLGAVRNNFLAMKEKLRDGTKIIAVVKADGYGHGAVPIARMAEPWDFIWGFAAATVEEAVELRLAGIKKPILILGCVFEEDYEKLTATGYAPRFFSCPRPENCPKRLSGPELRFRCTWQWIRG